MSKDNAVSAAQQRLYIAENGGILNLKTREDILRIILDAEKSAALQLKKEDDCPVILVNPDTKEISINLDNITNENIIQHIYNVVVTRRNVLNTPVVL